MNEWHSLHVVHELIAIILSLSQSPGGPIMLIGIHSSDITIRSHISIEISMSCSSVTRVHRWNKQCMQKQMFYYSHIDRVTNELVGFFYRYRVWKIVALGETKNIQQFFGRKKPQIAICYGSIFAFRYIAFNQEIVFPVGVELPLFRIRSEVRYMLSRSTLRGLQGPGNIENRPCAFDVTGIRFSEAGWCGITFSAYVKAPTRGFLQQVGRD